MQKMRKVICNQTRAADIRLHQPKGWGVIGKVDVKYTVPPPLSATGKQVTYELDKSFQSAAPAEVWANSLKPKDSKTMPEYRCTRCGCTGHPFAASF